MRSRWTTTRSEPWRRGSSGRRWEGMHATGLIVLLSVSRYFLYLAVPTESYDRRKVSVEGC